MSMLLVGVFGVVGVTVVLLMLVITRCVLTAKLFLSSKPLIYAQSPMLDVP